MAQSSSHWMQGAVKHPGAFTKQAKAHDMGTQQFAHAVLSGKVKANSTTKKRATLDETFAKLRGEK